MFKFEALKKLGGGFHCENNPGLCGVGFSSLRVCTTWDNVNINQIQPYAIPNNTASNSIPEPVTIHSHCNQTHCSNRSKLPKIAIVASLITLILTLVVFGFLLIFQHRRRKQKVGNTSENSDDRLSTEPVKEFYSRSASPLVALEYSNGWDPMFDGQNGNGVWPEFFNSFRFNLEEVESATQYFSESNLLGKSKFSTVYKGVLKDGSLVAIKSINATSCKSEEAEFVKGLSLLMSLKHENLVRLRGFCCSKGRGECFLIYDFASKGNLSSYLDVVDGSTNVLEWSTRVSIINGIAKGWSYIKFLHTSFLSRRENSFPLTVRSAIFFIKSWELKSSEAWNYLQKKNYHICIWVLYIHKPFTNNAN